MPAAGNGKMSRWVVSLLVGILAKIQIYGMRAGGMTRYGQGWWHQKDSTLGHRSQSSEKKLNYKGNKEKGKGELQLSRNWLSIRETETHTGKTG